MKPILITFLIIFGLVACSSQDNLHDTNGKTYSRNGFNGKWIVVNYWAAWCGGCVKEIPELNHFYLHHLNSNIILLGVNYDHVPMPELKNWVDKEKISYPVLVEDPKAFFNLSDADVLPVTFIINPEGKVVKSIVGPNTEKSLSNTLRVLQK